LAASCDHKPWQALQPPTQRSIRDVKRAVSVMRARNGVFTDCPSKERTVIHPLSLKELKLPAQMGSDEREHQSPIDAVIVQDAVRQFGTVRSSAPDHSVNARDTRDVGVARVHATN